MLKCSIIIPNYNGLRFIQPCLDALRNQTYPGELTEVILVDDASTDESVPFVQAHYPEVRVVRLAQNSGLAVGCNAGAAVATGDLLVMLNNDTEAEPGWLAALAAAAEAPPGRRCICQQDAALRPPRHAVRQRGDVMGVDGILATAGSGSATQANHDDRPVVFGGCGGGWPIPRGVEQTGGFDARLFMYLEDVDLAWRLLFAAGPQCSCPPRGSTIT